MFDKTVATKVDEPTKEILDMADRYSNYWKNFNAGYWLSRLNEEVAELTLSLNGEHKDFPEHEMKQIASICINWLRLRYEENDKI